MLSHGTFINDDDGERDGGVDSTIRDPLLLPKLVFCDNESVPLKIVILADFLHRQKKKMKCYFIFWSQKFTNCCARFYTKD